jgi:hypothetical protein
VKALFKTLFGDVTNITFVALVLALEFLLVHNGYAADAALAVPAAILAGTAWLAGK